MHSWPEEPEINDMVPDLYVYNPQKYFEPWSKGIIMNGIILPVTVYNETRYYRSYG